MALSEMIYEAMNDLLLPFVACRFLARFNYLEIGTRGAAVSGFADLDELGFFCHPAHSCPSQRRISTLSEGDTR